MSQSTAVATQGARASREGAVSLYSSMSVFEEAYRIARALSSSNLVPTSYRGEDNVPNALVALDMANRMNISPIMVMQNLHVIEGRPSWSAPFIIGALNSCGMFSPLRFKIEKLGKRKVEFEKWEGPRDQRRKSVATMEVEDMTCHVETEDKTTGEVLTGPVVSIGMAVAEGWYGRNGSKWKTMPDLMLRYRAAAFFGRLYAPHILNGMPTADEAVEIEADYTVLPSNPPAADAAPETQPQARRPGRPRGVDAALRNGTQPEGKPADEGTPAKPASRTRRAAPEPEPEIEDVEADDADASGDETSDEGSEGERGDMFGAPGDEDDDSYQPA